MSHPIGRLDPPTREALEVLGHVLRALRKERGLSQRTLADRCGLSQATISRLESGKAEGVRVAWIARLLAGLDARVSILPDERHLLARNHGFRKLHVAFDVSHGHARARARDLERRRTVDALKLRLDLQRGAQEDAELADAG